MRIVIHGGAGSTPDEPSDRARVLDEAAAAGIGASTPVDAVESAVRVLETSPRFNAGIGGVVQSDGAVRPDAGLMTGDRRAGAICGVPGIEHPVSLARTVLERTPHVLVGMPGAVELAAASGLATDVDLLTDRTRAGWAALEPVPDDDDARLDWISERFGEVPVGSDHDTVGAVATDGDAVAAATSTGGRWAALAGRIGDSPQIGAGFFAGPAGGASATGAGEAIAKAGLTRRAVDHLEAGMAAQAAADRAIDELERVTGDTAGVIVLDREGSFGTATNAEAMQTVTTGDFDE